MGVWIETLLQRIDNMRADVTPFVGVWIETSQANAYKVSDAKSHPSWVCGLKLQRNRCINGTCRSHPSWVCGLKHLISLIGIRFTKVTPFVGVWIETNQ